MDENLDVLIGIWKGDKGVDVSPERDGPAENPYYETLCIEAAGEAENAEEQVLKVLRYHQVVQRKSNDEVFHDQVGYWMWDASQDLLVQSLSIPRALTLLAGGSLEVLRPDACRLRVESNSGAKSFGIVQSPFLLAKARTTHYEHELIAEGDCLRYSETTIVEVYGQRFEHTDQNSLQRVLSS